MTPLPAGLEEAEARARLAQSGPNILQQSGSRGMLQIARGTLREPMFLYLLAAAGLYLLVGNLGEGLFLVAGAIVSIGLVVVQELRSQRALDALQALAEPFARVIRGGVERRIMTRDLVPGDIVLVGEGERVPLDGVLVGGDVLTVDESLLTGESIPVDKVVAEALPAEPDASALFAGSLVVRGHGMVRALRTGRTTRLGRISGLLATIENEPTLLQQASSRLIGRLGLLALGFCLVVLIAYGLLRGDWIAGALAGITLAIALLPEEFPMILAVFMALGAWRLAQQNVLVRRAAVIETLGAATLLCVDKTGTLTENRMRVAALWVDGELHELAQAVAIGPEATRLIRKAALASAVHTVDPMDQAIRNLAQAAKIDGRQTEGVEPVRTHPLHPDLLAVIQVWADGGNGSVIAAKGAPEAIFRLCRMDAGRQAQIHDVVAAMAQRGLRVLGVASRTQAGAAPDDLADGAYDFEGLVGFSDPMRPDVPAALSSAREAGVGIAMITGDYPATALAIAREAGIETAPGVLSGSEIAVLPLPVLRERIRSIRVFARVLPEQKLALVEAFKANGEVLVMTGDGVNDAPALAAAHIGIAMGERGTDVAREAADIVLLDDSIASIVRGIALGRAIFMNLRKALTFVTAVHIPIAGLALLPILLGLPPLLYPLHVVLLELVIDPVCSLVFEAEPGGQGAMRRPPRAATEKLFGRREVRFAILQGFLILAGVFGLYAWALQSGKEEPAARALAFVALIFSNLVLAFADSAEPGTRFLDRRRKIFWMIASATAVFVAVIVFQPTVAALFQLSAPHPLALLSALGIALLAAGWFGFLRRAGLLRVAG